MRPAGGRRERVVVTPEHVRIRLTPAGPGSRFLALLIDFALILAVSALVASGLRAVLPSGVSQAAAVTVQFVTTWVYHVGFETRRQGRTPGKGAVGLRVVDGRGLPLTVEQSFVRNVVRVLDFAPLFYGLGGLFCLLDRDRRRLGDLVADTLVVEERRPWAPGPRPDLAAHGEAPEPDLARRIRHRVSLEERELLLALCRRADRLDDRARYDLMERVGAHFRAKLAIDDPHLSGESLVRELAAAISGERLLTRPDRL